MTKIASIVLAVVALLRGAVAPVVTTSPEDMFPGWPLVAGGGPTSSSNFVQYLVNRYNQELMAEHERAMAKFYDRTKEFTDGGTPSGAGRIYGIRTKDSHAAGAIPEGGDLPVFVQPATIQVNVQPKSCSASLAWTELMLSIAQAPDAISGVDIITDHVEMAMRNAMVAINRHSLGHGTGRVAVVQANTSSSTSFIVRNPESHYQLRNGMRIGFYDLDSGGSLQGNVQTITDINLDTRVVTIDASRSLTAGWGVYIATGASGAASNTEYGITALGLRGINDNGSLAANFHDKVRATTPLALNAQVVTSSTTAGLTYSEKLIRKGLNRVRMYNNGEVDELWCNLGIVGEHYNHLTGNRVWQLGPGENVPNYPIGAKGEPVFIYGSRRIPFMIEEDLPNRELHGIVRKLYRKHTARKLAWIGDETGPDGLPKPILMQAPGTASNTYSTQKVAGMLAFYNLSHKLPGAGIVWRELADEELAGDLT